MHVTIDVPHFQIASKEILGVPNIIRQVRSLILLGVRQITISQWDDTIFRPLFKKYHLIHEVHPAVNIPDNTDLVLPSDYFLHHDLISILLKKPSHHIIQDLTQYDKNLWQYLVNDKYSIKKSEDLYLKSSFILKIAFHMIHLLNLNSIKCSLLEFIFFILGIGGFYFKSSYFVLGSFLLASIIYKASSFSSEIYLIPYKNNPYLDYTKWILFYLYLSFIENSIFDIYGKLALISLSCGLVILLFQRYFSDLAFNLSYRKRGSFLYLLLFFSLILNFHNFFFWIMTLGMILLTIIQLARARLNQYKR